MRKSLVLFILIYAYIWGCSGSEDEYSLLDNGDRKAVAKICNCIEPLEYYKQKMTEGSDTAQKRMYMDTFKIKAAELYPCIEEFEKLEIKFGTGEKFREQFVAYVKKKHPYCSKFMLGIGPTDSVNTKK